MRHCCCCSLQMCRVADLRLAAETRFSNYLLLSTSFAVAATFLSGLIMGLMLSPQLFLAYLVATTDQLNVPIFHIFFMSFERFVNVHYMY